MHNSSHTSLTALSHNNTIQREKKVACATPTDRSIYQQPDSEQSVIPSSLSQAARTRDCAFMPPLIGVPDMHPLFQTTRSDSSGLLVLRSQTPH